MPEARGGCATGEMALRQLNSSANQLIYMDFDYLFFAMCPQMSPVAVGPVNLWGYGEGPPLQFFLILPILRQGDN